MRECLDAHAIGDRRLLADDPRANVRIADRVRENNPANP
jgi:hypothetical protein